MNLSKMADLNISSSKLNGRQGRSDKKHNLFTSRSVFTLPMLFSRLSTVLFIDREIHETIPSNVGGVFHFLREIIVEKNFSQ